MQLDASKLDEETHQANAPKHSLETEKQQKFVQERVKVFFRTHVACAHSSASMTMVVSTHIVSGPRRTTNKAAFAAYSQQSIAQFTACAIWEQPKH
jgi:hypothetical protein